MREFLKRTAAVADDNGGSTLAKELVGKTNKMSVGTKTDLRPGLTRPKREKKLAALLVLLAIHLCTARVQSW